MKNLRFNLRFYYLSIYLSIVSGVYYDDDEEVDNYGGSTDGKSFDVTKNF